MFLLVCLLNIYQVLFTVKQLYTNNPQRSSPSLDSYEWQGEWDGIEGTWNSGHLQIWNFMSEEQQNLEKLVKYLEKVCCQHGNSGEPQIIARLQNTWNWLFYESKQLYHSPYADPEGTGETVGCWQAMKLLYCCWASASRWQATALQLSLWLCFHFPLLSQ